MARPTPAAADSADSFVTRCGIRFCLDGEEYYTLSDRGTTFNGSVTIRNTGGTPVEGRQLAFDFPGDQRITQMWNAVPEQDGRNVTATDPSGYNVTIVPGTTVNFGFNGTSSAGTNGVPTAFTLNGKPCTTT
ncbi:cellulose binding domain-containing protein [Streptomyces sp. NPDC006553]|uniref:cellulose binding domain-containing protein n=1 Tax=Streptomyces sp. NPDC006553 TaxID=3157180 RepID=UPI0033A3675E